MPLIIFGPRRPIQYLPPVIPVPAYLLSGRPVIASSENAQPFPGRFVGMFRGGVVSPDTTPTALGAQFISAEPARPYSGDIFSRRGRPDPDQIPLPPSIPIPRLQPPWDIFSGALWMGIGKVPAVDVTVTGPPVLFFSTESPQPTKGVFYPGIGHPPIPDVTAPRITPWFFRTEAPPPYGGNVLVCNGGPELVSVVPAVTMVVMAWAENAPMFRGAAVLFTGVTPPSTIPSPPPVFFALSENPPVYSGNVVKFRGIALTQDAPVVTPVIFAKAENAPIFGGRLAQSIGGVVSGDVTPIALPIVFAHTEEPKPDRGNFFSTGAISVWWPFAPTPAMIRAEMPLPPPGTILYEHAWDSVTPQTPTPPILIASAMNAPPWPGFVLLAGQTIWQKIITITSTTVVELFLLESRPNTVVVSDRTATNFVDDRRSTVMVSPTSR